MVKAHGNTVSDVGRQFGPSELYFVNPNAVKSISTLFRVKRVDAVACPTNNTDSFGQMIFGGNYFNPGTGNPLDDVAAIIIVQHSAASPSAQLGLRDVCVLKIEGESTRPGCAFLMMSVIEIC